MPKQSNAELELKLAVMDDEMYEAQKELANRAITIMNEMAARDKQTTLDYLHRYCDGSLLQFIFQDGINYRYSEALVEVFAAFKMRKEDL